MQYFAPDPPVFFRLHNTGSQYHIEDRGGVGPKSRWPRLSDKELLPRQKRQWAFLPPTYHLFIYRGLNHCLESVRSCVSLRVGASECGMSLTCCPTQFRLCGWGVGNVVPPPRYCIWLLSSSPPFHTSTIFIFLLRMKSPSLPWDFTVLHNDTTLGSLWKMPDSIPGPLPQDLQIEN